MAQKTIALEEHFISSNAADVVPASLAKFYKAMQRQQPAWMEKLADITPVGSRIQAMDAGHVNIQVISNSFGVSSCSPEDVCAANDQLAAATKKQPRFKGFAALPMHHPEAAIAELERCVRSHGFVGALIDSHLDDGSYYDEEKFSPVFPKAEELAVPIYIHPTTPVDDVQAALYQGNYDVRLQMSLGIAAWGWHCDTALSLLRMYCSGIFQKLPRLKIVIGHMGEMLPFMLDRIDEKIAQMYPEAGMSFKQVWERHVWVTTSGLFTLPPMACLLRNTKMERIMYSVDYPYSDNEQGEAFLRELKESGMVSEEEFEMIAFKNAETLLGIKVET